MRLQSILATAIILSVSLAHGGRAAAQGHSLPTPIIVSAQPQMIYPGSQGWLDSGGRVRVVLLGENLAPNDGDHAHPTGHDGGYQHIFIRGVSPHGDKATAWVPATADNGCLIYGGMFLDVVTLGIDPGRYLSEPGSHLQVKVWVSLGPTEAADPAQSTALCSGWSAIKTLDVAPAGVSKPAVAPPVQTVPTIARIEPSNITLNVPSQSYRIRVYGFHISTPNLKVIFNGDTAGAISPEDVPSGWDEGQTPLKDADSMFHVTIPEKYRPTTPGRLTLTLNDGSTTGKPSAITFSPMAIKPVGRLVAPLPMLPLRPSVAASAGAPMALGQRAPVLTRLSATEFNLGDRGASYRIRLYGRNLCAADNKVIFNGDLAGAVAPEDACRNHDDDGTALKADEVLVHVTIPERYRRPGQVTVALLNGQGRSEPVTLTFKGTPLPVARPSIPQVPLRILVPPPAVKPPHG